MRLMHKGSEPLVCKSQSHNLRITAIIYYLLLSWFTGKKKNLREKGGWRLKEDRSNGMGWDGTHTSKMNSDSLDRSNSNYTV